MTICNLKTKFKFVIVTTNNHCISLYQTCNCINSLMLKNKNPSLFKMGLWGAHHERVVTLLSHKEMVNNWVCSEAIEKVKCEGGINAIQQTNDSQTYNLLFYAAFYGNKVAFNIMLRSGIDVMWRNNEGTNIMQMLAKNNYIKWAEWCLKCIEGEEEKKIRIHQ